MIHQNRSLSWVHKWKKEYGFTFGSSEPFWELIQEFCMRYSLWYIKIQFLWTINDTLRQYVKMSIFVGVVCCNYPHSFTSGSLYTSIDILLTPRIIPHPYRLFINSSSVVNKTALFYNKILRSYIWIKKLASPCLWH